MSAYKKGDNAPVSVGFRKVCKLTAHANGQKINHSIQWRTDIYFFIIFINYYSAFALLAMQSAKLARGILSVCPSVRPSDRPSRSGIMSRWMKIRSCGF